MILCPACAHSLHLYHRDEIETEVCMCIFCTEVSKEDEAFLMSVYYSQK